MIFKTQIFDTSYDTLYNNDKITCPENWRHGQNDHFFSKLL